MFTDAQIKNLSADLDRSAVKQRDQSGRKLSYIEGWHAIAEANRIFGFDGWDRETVDLRCVSERPREIGSRKDPGHGVTYIARVRITVYAGDRTIVREGCGTGHGIDRDLGQAHESALKEAETDAMKRALMTFGNPFGLALYDKDQKNVSASPHPLPPSPCDAADPPAPSSATASGAGDILETLRSALQMAAMHGSDALRDEWQTMHPTYQKKLSSEKERLKPIAEEVDQRRVRQVPAE